MQIMSMGRGRPRRADLVAGVVAGVVVSLAGCGGNTSGADGARGGAASGSSLPNPFTVSAQLSAGSLGLREPRGLAVGPDGNLYVTDGAERVTVVSPEGKVLRRWGKPGHGPGEFSFVPNDPSNPADVHADISVGGDGLVYVADSGNVRIEVFTPEGKFVRTVGMFGNGKGRFLAPYDVVADDGGVCLRRGRPAPDRVEALPGRPGHLADRWRRLG
jgi:hypothetical protein